jgi:hypothetical protein
LLLRIVAGLSLLSFGCQGSTHWLGADFAPDGGDGNDGDAGRDDLERGIYLSWTFDDPSTTVASDVSGNEHHGELRNVSPSDAAPTAREGNVRGTFFNGTGSTASVTVSDLSPAFTVAFWIKPADLSQAILLTREDARGSPRLRLSITAEGALALDDGQSAVPCADLVHCALAEQAIARDAWLHVAANVGEDGELRLYLDGIMAAGAHTDGSAALEGRIVIGAPIGSLLAGVRGVLDELVVYGRVLSDGEISALAARN